MMRINEAVDVHGFSGVFYAMGQIPPPDEMAGTTTKDINTHAVEGMVEKMKTRDHTRASMQTIKKYAPELYRALLEERYECICLVCVVMSYQFLLCCI
jgi:pheromone shutdown protein TraB